MRKVILILVMALLIVACGGPPERPVVINDKTYKIQEVSFTIACDTEKKLGIAYYSFGSGNGEYAIAGMLSEEDYRKWCE